MRLRTLLAVMLSLSACAANHPGTSDIPTIPLPSSAQTIAVVSSLPQKMRLATEGAGFTNTLEFVDIPLLHLDDVAFETVSKALSPRYRVMRGTVERPFVDDQSKLEALLDKESPLVDLVRHHVQTDGPADLYLVLAVSSRSGHGSSVTVPIVSPRLYGVMSAGQPTLWDIGVSKKEDLLFTRPPVVHVYLMMTIIDGTTFKVLGQVPLMMDPSRPFPTGMAASYGGGAAYPVQPLPEFEWQRHWADLPTDQRMQLLNTIVSLLAQSLTYTIQQSHLAP